MAIFNLFNKYRSSYIDSFKDITKHIFIYSSLLYSLYYFKDTYMNLFIIPFLGLMNMRTFIIFHDCGHNSYTPNKKLNYIIGSLLGIPVFTPFCWSYDHNNHHLTSGNKENKLNHGYNETIFHTLNEYKEMGNIFKKMYKIYRHPCLFPIISSFIKWGILLRADIYLYKIYDSNLYKQSKDNILFDTIFNNIGIMIFSYYLIYNSIYIQYIISFIISSSLGFILFHNQHTFNPSYVVDNKTWNKKDSGLKGSSFIQIPKYFKYFTHGIEYHHIHHMNASIPCYHLQKFHEELILDCSFKKEYKCITELSIYDCYCNLWLTLYDENNDKYISFKEADKVK
jgi:acyl-lipid omega-6 desaturase (Delta-12 desaturase)